nr:hypothetical protein [Mucilaginibacter phyllosphaerae]
MSPAPGSLHQRISQRISNQRQLCTLKITYHRRRCNHARAARLFIKP